MLICRFRAVARVAAIIMSLGIGTASAQNELFVGNTGNNSMTVYSRTANGNVVPLRTLSGAATGLNSPQGIAVDTVNNELFVANSISGTVTVYTVTANGNVAPLRTIAGVATGMNIPEGLAVDTVNNELIVMQVGTPAITVYARTASGNAAPIRTIVGAATGLAGPGISVDTVNNELAVTNVSPNTVTVYSRTANGNVAPLRTISGAATGLDVPTDVAVDAVNNELAVVNLGLGASSVTVYARTANGNVAPLRTISGAATGLNGALGIAMDAVNNELEVSNVNTNTLTVYARTATGNVAPLRTIGGVATGLNNPNKLAVTTSAAPPTPPTAAKNFGAATIPLNGSTSLTFTISNPNALSQVSGVFLNDSLPVGLVVSTPNGLVDGCHGVTATAGSGTISLNDIILAANTSCTYSVNVTGTTLGLKNNVSDPITSDQGTGGTASASVTVVAVGPPPPPPPPPLTNTPIPTLQQWALGLLGLLLIGSAGVTLRRRKRA